jgi:hypothetical protein
LGPRFCRRRPEETIDNKPPTTTRISGAVEHSQTTRSTERFAHQVGRFAKRRPSALSFCPPFLPAAAAVDRRLVLAPQNKPLAAPDIGACLGVAAA